MQVMAHSPLPLSHPLVKSLGEKAHPIIYLSLNKMGYKRVTVQTCRQHLLELWILSECKQHFLCLLSIQYLVTRPSNHNDDKYWL